MRRRIWRSSASAATRVGQTSTKLKVTGIDLFSAGDFMGGEGTEEIVLSDPIGGVYKKLVIRDDKLVGGVPVRRHGRRRWYFKLLREGRDDRRASATT